MEFRRGLVRSFRIGNGWSWPEPEGCRILPGGGMLRFRIARRPARRLRLCLHVRGLASRDCPVTISINDAPPEMFTVAASTSSWLIAEISASNEEIGRAACRERVCQYV